jgi:hypothetical protein
MDHEVPYVFFAVHENQETTGYYLRGLCALLEYPDSSVLKYVQGPTKSYYVKPYTF